MWFKGLPWYAQILIIIVIALVAVFLFQNIAQPLIRDIK